MNDLKAAYLADLHLRKMSPSTIKHVDIGSMLISGGAMRGPWIPTGPGERIS